MLVDVQTRLHTAPIAQEVEAAQDAVSPTVPDTLRLAGRDGAITRLLANWHQGWNTDREGNIGICCHEMG